MAVTTLASVETPAALVDVPRMQANITRMQSRMDALGVKLRPHVKTSKCLDVVQRQLEAGSRGITVSTLKEAEEFFAAGIDDILYAVGIAPASSCRRTTSRHLLVLTCGRSFTPSASMRDCMRVMLACMWGMSMRAAGVSRAARVITAARSR